MKREFRMLVIRLREREEKKGNVVKEHRLTVK